MEILQNTAILIPFLLAVTFYSLVSASVVLALFIYNRKFPVLINVIILYICFFIAFSQYILRNESLIEAIRIGQEQEKLTIIYSSSVFIINIAIIIVCTFSLRNVTKGFIDARSDIVASVKALIPPNSNWKPEQGLTDSIVNKYRITEAEKAVANQALLGLSNKEIATKLNKAVGTVEVQLKSVYQKTESPGRYALMAMVAKSTTAEKE